MKILIIEDEIEILIAISNFLIKENHVCELAESYSKANEKLSIYEYDIIHLYITLTDGNGLDLIKKIKIHNIKSGLIIISAKNSLDDKISGLDLGADDYITKPFQLSELNSRINAVLRRTSNKEVVIFESRGFLLNIKQMKLYKNSEEIVITSTEFKIIRLLMERI